MTSNPYGEIMDEPYACEHCCPIRTTASRARTLMNVKECMIIQLKTFGYDQITRQPFKTIPKLVIEEEINNILLGKLKLLAIVYHIGTSPNHGHYVTAVKFCDEWYTCNDAIVEIGVKLNCDPTVDADERSMIPYLLIYTKDVESNVIAESNVCHENEIVVGDPMMIVDDSNEDIDFLNHTQVDPKVEVVHADITTLNFDAILNAANESLLGGGGIDKVIHKAAGPRLLKECRRLNGCETGECKVTGGYDLPAKYIFHTVAPRTEDPVKLRACYENCLLNVKNYDEVRTIAFCCIGTGIFKYNKHSCSAPGFYSCALSCATV